MGLFCKSVARVAKNSGQDSRGNPASTFSYQSYESLQHLRA